MMPADEPGLRECRRCGCTDDDCSGCIERTGRPCNWVEDDLCSACANVAAPRRPAGVVGTLPAGAGEFHYTGARGHWGAAVQPPPRGRFSPREPTP